MAQVWQIYQQSNRSNTVADKPALQEILKNCSIPAWY